MNYLHKTRYLIDLNKVFQSNKKVDFNIEN